MKVIFCTWLIILNWVTHFGFYPSNLLSRYWILILLLIKSEGFDPCRCLKCYINGSTISISLQFPVRISFQIKDQLVIYSHMAWLNCCGKQILLWPDSWLFKCRADPPAFPSFTHFQARETHDTDTHCDFTPFEFYTRAAGSSARWATPNINSNVSRLNSWLLPRPPARNAVRDSGFKG